MAKSLSKRAIPPSNTKQTLYYHRLALVSCLVSLVLALVVTVAQSANPSLPSPIAIPSPITPGDITSSGNCYISVCPKPECLNNTIPSSIYVTAPVQKTLVNLGAPLFLNWTYADGANQAYPITGTYIYYQVSGKPDYELIGPPVPPGRTNFTFTIPPMQPAVINIFILPDNVWLVPNSVGVRPSCIDQGFPLGAKWIITGYTPSVVSPTTLNPKFQPFTSSASMIRQSLLSGWYLVVLCFAVFSLW